MAKDLTAALDALSGGYSGSRQDTRLPSATTLPDIPQRTGVAAPKATSSGSGGGGIASPLVETAYADRLWFSERSVVSADGLFTMRVRPINTIKFADANANIVEIKYKAAT